MPDWGGRERQGEGRNGQREQQEENNRQGAPWRGWGPTSTSVLLEREKTARRKRTLLRMTSHPGWSVCHSKEIQFSSLDKEKLRKGFRKSDLHA